jgi:hypothetical protein
MTNHATHEQLSALLDDRLPPSERSALSTHLAACADCRRDQSRLADIRGRLQALPPLHPPERFYQNVLSKTTRQQRAPIFSWAWATPLAAAAVVLVMVHVTREIKQNPTRNVEEMIAPGTQPETVVPAPLPSRPGAGGGPVGFENSIRPAKRESAGLPVAALIQDWGGLRRPSSTVGKGAGAGNYSTGAAELPSQFQETLDVSVSKTKAPIPVGSSMVAGVKPAAIPGGGTLKERIALQKNRSQIDANRPIFRDEASKGIGGVRQDARGAGRAPGRERKDLYYENVDDTRAVESDEKRSAGQIATTEWSGDWGGETAKRTVVCRNAAQWVALWSSQSRPLPGADFSRWTAVGVFLGTRPSGGYGVELTSVVNTPRETVVRWRETKPRPDETVIAALTQPYRIRLIPRTDLPVRFVEE